MIPFDLYWLPENETFNKDLKAAARAPGTAEEVLTRFRDLATCRLDFLKTTKLDRTFQSVRAEVDETDIAARKIKIALLSSCTVDHLVPAIRVGALRRGLIADCYVAPYGMYHQEAIDPSSGLRRFEPDVVLMNLDSQAVLSELPYTASAQEVEDTIGVRVDEIAGLWNILQDEIGAVVIQQAVLDRSQPLFGNYEARVPAAPTRMIQQFNWQLSNRASEAKALWLDMDHWARRVGTRNLSDSRLWHQAKQEISPMQSPLYGDLVARQLAAIRGLSKKCLVLDLDNTVWGGVIGDDGLDGIVLGQGDPLGEAFTAFQEYAKALSKRGIILAVASKNDEDVAKSAFEKHPEMTLQLSDIAAFEANWFDKPASLQRIAKDLNIGIDSLVFFDDNPMERALVRETLPEVSVPEVPLAAEEYIACLADGGYFETVGFTADDTKRTEQYVANRQRSESQSRAADLDSFLHDLQMELVVGSFDKTNLSRIVQLINKTNQFNLTTRRYTEAEVLDLMKDDRAETFHVRLKDRFGDNGIIAIVIANHLAEGNDAVLDVDTWLMSCRVLGRRVEEAVLNLLVDAANRRGARAVRGRYVPSNRNGMVREHYAKLGFEPAGENDMTDGGTTEWELPVAGYEPQFTNLFEKVFADGTS